MSAIAVSIALVSSFALWATLHGVLAFGLIRRSPLGWWLLLLAFPITLWLAPYWGFKHGLKLRSAAWLLMLLMYVVLLLVGARWQS